MGLKYLIGHRGFRQSVHENTREAFDVAVQHHLDYIEFDIQMTADNVPVIFHDSSLTRMARIDKPLNRLTHSDIERLVKESNGTEVPILEEIIKEYKDKIRFMIEIKDPAVTNPLITLLKQYHLTQEVCVSGRALPPLKQVKDVLLHCELCLNITNSRDFPLSQFLRLKQASDLPLPFTFISLSAQKISTHFIKHCHEFQIIPTMWNLMNEKDSLQRLLHYEMQGLQACLFDSPETVKEYRAIRQI